MAPVILSFDLSYRRTSDNVGACRRRFPSSLGFGYGFLWACVRPMTLLINARKAPPPPTLSGNGGFRFPTESHGRGRCLTSTRLSTESWVAALVKNFQNYGRCVRDLRHRPSDWWAVLLPG